MTEIRHDEELQWLLDYCARQFVEEGTWPDTRTVRRDAARAGVELDGFFFATPPRDFVFRRDHDGVRLSALGLSRAAATAPLLQALVRFARLCADIYLGADDPPTVTAETLRDRLGMDDYMIDRINKLFTSAEYFLTSGGRETDTTHWSYDVNDLARKFAGVDTLDQYLAVRHSIVEPRPLDAPLLPKDFLAILDSPLDPLGAGDAQSRSESPDEHAGNPLVVFVSWAHSNDDWQESVLKFTDLLRAEGLDARVDLYDRHKGVDWQLYGTKWISRADFVLIVVSSEYKERWAMDSPIGTGAGVAREAVTLRHLFDEDREAFLRKVRVVLLPRIETATIPPDISHLSWVRVSELTSNGIDDVVRHITGEPAYPMPNLGPRRKRGPRVRSAESVYEVAPSEPGTEECPPDVASEDARLEKMVASVKALLSTGKSRIALRSFLVGQVRELRTFLETLGPDNPPDFSEAYRRRIEEVVVRAQPLAAGLAAGCFYGEPPQRTIWTEVLHSVAQQPDPMVGAVWTLWTAVLRLPATMLLYSGVIGAWRAADLQTMIDLLSIEVRHSFSTGGLTTYSAVECPAYVALAPPEVLEQWQLGIGPAGGPIQLSNEIYGAVSPALADQYPVQTDLARAFEDVEYLMALMQYDWHASHQVQGHSRWKVRRFHSGLIHVRGAAIHPPPTVMDRFNRRVGPLSSASLLQAGLFGGRQRRLDEALIGVNSRI